VGVEANVRLPVWFSLEDIGEAAMDYPLPAQAIAPFLGVPRNVPPLWKPLEQPQLVELAQGPMPGRQGCEVRRDRQEQQRGRRKKGVIRLADLTKEMEKESGGKKKETSAELKKKARDQYAPYVNESVNVLLDMVTLSLAS